eukprot:2935313-Rhodomonas_salina.3
MAWTHARSQTAMPTRNIGQLVQLAVKEDEVCLSEVPELQRCRFSADAGGERGRERREEGERRREDGGSGRLEAGRGGAHQGGR